MSYLIGIAGPSCAGKSELTRRVAEVLGAGILPIDAYYRDLRHLTLQQRAGTNFDDPAAVEHELILRHLRELRRGRAIEKPVYDFARHLRVPEVERVSPGAFLILEGLFALYWEEVRTLLQTKVFVSAPDAVCFDRRLARDVRERGRTPESVHTQYSGTVRPMAERFVWPAAEFADLVVSGTDPLEKSVAAVVAHVQAAPRR